MADIEDIKEWLAEVLGQQTFDGEITEFVDWVTGNDSFNNRNVTGGLPVSGRRIRELLQKRLKEPLVFYEDKDAGLFRVFASAASRDRWIAGHDPQNPAYDEEGTSSLELFNFERPSEFAVGQVGIVQEPRYIIKGDTSSAGAELSFYVTVKDAKGQTKSDTILVTYTIVNTVSGIAKQLPAEEYGASYVNDPNMRITKNLYPYLGDGQNSVNVRIQGVGVGSYIDIPFGIYLVDFTLQSDFDYMRAKVSGNDIEIPFEINRSTAVEGSALTVSAYVDGSLAKLAVNGSDAIWQTSDTATRVRGTLKIKNTYEPSDGDHPHRMHTLRLVSNMGIYNSNVLFFQFEVAATEQGFKNNFVNIAASIPYNQVDIYDGELILKGTQYEPFALDWAYYTDQLQLEQSVDVDFALQRTTDEGDVLEHIVTIVGVKGESKRLTFIPETPTSDGENARLVAMINGNIIDSWPIAIARSTLNIYEASGYDLKLSAYGKSNSSPDRDQWRDERNGVDTTFSSGVTFDSTSGWEDNGLFLIGTDAYAMIDYCPFPSTFAPTGRTIELEFKTEQVDSEDDVLIDIGTAEHGRIVVTPTRARLLLGGTEVVSTHFKANERIKLSFIFNKADNLDSSINNLVWIVNNGILERASGAGEALSYVDTAGRIKIGGSQSGIRLYMLRCYPSALGYQEAYENYVYDALDKVEILLRNNIIEGGSINYDKVKNVMDTILIEGDLSRILNKDANKEDSESTVNITRTCPSDPSKNFTVKNGKARKHGQSTLNYPISSMKIWLNKSATDGVNPELTLSAIQQAMQLNKGRYVFKNGAIPANKFVLQANYADSSGANNGAIQRLLQKTWYDAVIDGEHKLRTSPQLFASGETVSHQDANLGETGDAAWTDGYGSGKASGKTWKDVSSKPFPYQIRTGADSLPCAVFYKDTTGDGTIRFLGQYVLMDDKKSDHVFGERSIYHYYDETDPFCLKIENKDQDTKDNRVWNNNNVVRIEDVLLDTKLTSFMDFNVPKSQADNVNAGSTVRADAIEYDSRGNKVGFYWERYFEMIYPDPDDFEVKVGDVKVKEDKFAEDSGFRKKAAMFLDFMQWICGIGQLNASTVSGGERVSAEALAAFKQTAAQHLDLWKLAGYYVLLLRFGLVDSVERNAQWKTYDGRHWHCEPWDMDIANGNKNDGGFAFEPPINRDTKLPTDATKYAYSGRSTVTSNVLWDCLEAWDYWKDVVVPKTAQALYTAGLDYDSVIKLFDEGYSEVWSETMYNQSGYYKYIEMRGGDNDWLRWLQGAALSHRHWWLSVSMNYYDAMWTAGDFNNHRIYIAAEKALGVPGVVSIKPTGDTFFKMTQNDGNTSLGTKEAHKGQATTYDITESSFSVKDPTHIYGATFIEELNLSAFAAKLSSLALGGAYDKVLGAPIKVLNIGMPLTKVSDTAYTGHVSGTALNLSGTTSEGDDALGNIKVLDITGQQSISNTDSLLLNNNRRTLQNLYAIGTGLTSFTSARSGNRFVELRLPAKTVKGGEVLTQLGSMTLTDSSWEKLSFWTTEITGEASTHTDTDADGQEIIIHEANPASFTNTGIPVTLTVLVMRGQTAGNLCAAQLVMGWIAAIEADVRSAAAVGATEDEIEEALLRRLKSYTLNAENIRWGTDEVPVSIYYKDLRRLAALNNGNNQNANLKGYIRIADTEELTGEQLTQLATWFGPSVFNKANINSGLIVDQAKNYVQISVSGKDVTIEDGHITLHEGGIADLNATKFILSEDSTDYLFTWSSPNPLASASLVKGADGITRLYTSENSIGDYVITVSVRAQGVEERSVDIHVVGVTYPKEWAFRTVSRTQGKATRQLKASERVMKSIFGNSAAYQNVTDGILRDCYVLYEGLLSYEFYAEAVDDEGAPADYTATLKGIKYAVTSMESDTGGSEINNLTDSSELSTGDATPVSVGYDQSESAHWLYFNRDSQHHGVTLLTQNAVPNTMKRYVVTVEISIGNKTEYKYINLLVVNDGSAVVRAGNSPLYLVLKNKIDAQRTDDLYKLDLMTVDGEVDFRGSNLSSLVTERHDSALKYLQHCTSLRLDGLSIAATSQAIDGSDKRQLVFSQMEDLEKLTMTGATFTYDDTAASVLDLTENRKLSEADLRGTSAGIRIAPESIAHNVETIRLGSPLSIELKKLSRLGIAGQVTGSETGFSIQDGSHVEFLAIENVSTNELCGFALFGTIFSD